MVDTVDPDSYEISTSEKYRNKEIIRCIGDDTNRPIPQLLSGTIEVMEAWENGDLSEGQAAKCLGMHRLQARTLWARYRQQ